jgi:hypothetical protein
MEQGILVDGPTEDGNTKNLGRGLDLEIRSNPQQAKLSRNGTYIKSVDLSDKVAMRVFVVETVELGAQKGRLAKALGISRQTIHNYEAIKAQFGMEGLIQGYSKKKKSRRQHRKEQSHRRIPGNKAKLVAEERAKTRQEQESTQQLLSFSYDGKEALKVAKDDEPFSEEHEWQASRYAGVFSYLICLVGVWNWLQLVVGYCGASYKIFMVFMLMAARNIRSIEQLKNVRAREAGVVLGIKRLTSKPKVWEWFYSVANMLVSAPLLADYFRYQIRAGLVGIWTWFTDGHLLPYTGKEKVHSSYNTQRRMPVPGQTNLVTCDRSGRVVDFEIQEGKGDLRSRIVELGSRWSEEVFACPVMVFDREGNGTGFFSRLVLSGTPFVTWEKNADRKMLAAVDEKKFTEEFELNGKDYGVFEKEKSFSFTSDEPDAVEHSFTLRHVFLWNKTSRRRASGLAWDGGKQMSTIDCARAILSRWGASENTFKHFVNRHPLHYHPGFEMVESDKQEIANPALKQKENEIKRCQKDLGKLYKKMTKTKKVINKDGTPRKNSVKERTKISIDGKEAELVRLQEEKRQLPERVDVSTLEDYSIFKRIQNEGKYLFDFVTCSVWNARKQMVDWLRPFLNQDSEVVDLFYAITDCHGWIKSTKQEVIVRLEPLQQPMRRSAQEQLCRKLSSLGAQTPTGKRLLIEVGTRPPRATKNVLKKRGGRTMSLRCLLFGPWSRTS